MLLAVGITKADGDFAEFLGFVRHQMRLQIEHDLQAMLDLAEETVVVLQNRPFLVRETAGLFKSLDRGIMTRIVGKFVRELEIMLREKKVHLEVGEDAIEWLAEKGYDPKMGARPLARLIQTSLKQVLAEQILFGQLSKGGTARVSVGEDGNLHFDCAPPGSDEVRQASEDPAAATPVA